MAQGAAKRFQRSGVKQCAQDLDAGLIGTMVFAYRKMTPSLL